MSVNNDLIVHYTKKMETLESIIFDKSFRLHYCTEFVTAENDTHVGFLNSAVPMVCFTDIPFSEIKGHLLKYGSYGIGFTKRWALAHKLNPVLYMGKNSSLIWTVNQLQTLSQQLFDKLETPAVNRNLHEDFLKHYNRFLGYIKNYQSNAPEDYVYYNEREWRYSPSEEDAMGLFTSEEIYQKNPGPYDECAKKHPLQFDYHEIERIILNKETDTSVFFNNLKMKGIKKANLDLLASKIIIVEKDFT